MVRAKAEWRERRLPMTGLAADDAPEVLTQFGLYTPLMFARPDAKADQLQAAPVKPSAFS